ncbi:uncharacterized protein EV422DRAFT_40737 [Fimicolochytrium jonesii]|uniref:uncharacterized protein n=1 Tax=Fimicolochytrium jonesii TaxID=1396493 RepID=UPI0022FE0162|nr:uncharacterized protein EV422DRAFT_40737 [Fimicolochytrium jonesii]KAI8821395.1 hypothetical protein EV422DRAFT_40737 [Fimicolochytrium jonesii]
MFARLKAIIKMILHPTRASASSVPSAPPVNPAQGRYRVLGESPASERIRTVRTARPTPRNNTTTVVTKKKKEGPGEPPKTTNRRLRELESVYRSTGTLNNSSSPVPAPTKPTKPSYVASGPGNSTRRASGVATIRQNILDRINRRSSDSEQNPPVKRPSGSRKSLELNLPRLFSKTPPVEVQKPKAPSLRRKSSIFGSQQSTLSTVSASQRSLRSFSELDIRKLTTIKKKRGCTAQYALKRETPARGRVGLKNLGNTCYMNAALQCLLSAELLMGYVLSPTYTASITNSQDNGLAEAFADLVKAAMTTSDRRILDPVAVKRQVARRNEQFAEYDQQDAQELLRCLLDGLHENLNRVKRRPRLNYSHDDAERLSDSEKARFAWNKYHAVNDSTIFDLFGGQLESCVECHTCGHRSVTYDTFWDLSLPIPKGSSATLQDCLSDFGADEILEDLYSCANCKARRVASKTLKVYRCPEILVLHLKRFKYISYDTQEKIEANVEFPLENLRLGGLLSDVEGHDTNAVYDLFGIINHFGVPGGGHYTANVKNIDDGRWYSKNDSSVSLCPDGPSTAMRSSAYVLFYSRRR